MQDYKRKLNFKKAIHKNLKQSEISSNTEWNKHKGQKEQQKKKKKKNKFQQFFSNHIGGGGGGGGGIFILKLGVHVG